MPAWREPLIISVKSCLQKAMKNGSVGICSRWRQSRHTDVSSSSYKRLIILLKYKPVNFIRWVLMRWESCNTHMCIKKGANMKQANVKLSQASTGPWGSRKFRFAEFLNNGHIKVIRFSLTHRPSLPPRRNSWYSVLLGAESTSR